MTDIRYGTSRDPQWIAMVSSSCVLVMDRSLTQDRARDVWESVGGGSGSQSVLDALTRGGISSTPSFALAVLPTDFGTGQTDITMIVRGGLEVSITSITETLRLSGEGVSTWVEQPVTGVTSLRIGSHSSSTPAKASAETFVLNNGSAPVEWLTVGNTVVTATTSPVAASVPAAPSPVVERAVDPGVTITDPTLVTPAEPAEPERVEPDGGYDFLFGETVVRTVEDAAVREEPSREVVDAGDHDGRTAVGLSAAERRAARQARQKSTPSAAPAAPVFALTFSTGEREPLDSPLVIGRAPSASKVSATSVPRLVTVGGPDQDISRNHVQVSVEGGTVLVTDLHSRNGTMVTLPGRPPQQLRGGQPTAVISGAVVDLGSGITFTVGEN